MRVLDSHPLVNNCQIILLKHFYIILKTSPYGAVAVNVAVVSSVLSNVTV